VTLLVINNSRTETAVEMPLESRRYTLSAEPLQNGDVELNGAALKVEDSGDLPAIEGAAIAAGSVSFAPGTITFLAIERSGNSACRGS
jgi:heparanase 1